MSAAVALVQPPIRNPQCAYCADQSPSTLSTRPELVDEFLLNAEPRELLQLELVCHGRWEITPLVRAVFELGPAQSSTRRACTIREPEEWRRVYRMLCGCVLHREEARVAERTLPKFVVGGFLVLGNAHGDPTGHVALPIAHIIQHFARCG